MRILAFVAGLLSFGTAAWVVAARRMLGFPDGFMGPADRWLQPIMGVLALAALGLGCVSLWLGGAPMAAPRRARRVTVAVLLAVVLFGLSLIVEPTMRAWLPSTGG